MRNNKKPNLSYLAMVGIYFLACMSLSQAHETHGYYTLHDSLTHDSHQHDHDSTDQKSHKHDHPEQVKLVTGQGDFVFSWDEGLTAAFPEGAREHESKMHGGFNEDPETGIVYTGIPGYGLCSISPDLKTWTRIGTDERLKDNIHGIVFFVHKGKKHLAVAQEGKRVLVLNLDGSYCERYPQTQGE